MPLKKSLSASQRTSYRDQLSRSTRARSHRREQVRFYEPRNECGKRRTIMHRRVRSTRAREHRREQVRLYEPCENRGMEARSRIIVHARNVRVASSRAGPVRQTTTNTQKTTGDRASLRACNGCSWTTVAPIAW